MASRPEHCLSPHTLLAVPITKLDVPLAEQVRTACAAGAELVELRVDCLGGEAAVADLLAQPHEVPFILTIRTREEGGAWDGDEAARVALYQRLGLLEPGYLDVEYSSWVRSANVRQKIGLVCALGAVDRTAPEARPRRGRNRLILSHHDTRGTPSDLEAVAASLLETPADVVKLVFAARDATDAWRVISLLQRHSPRRNIVALAMGEAGLLTRVLAAKYGGFLTFATLRRGAESAPGQPTVDELRREYRWNAIGRATHVFGVVGWPVSQSRSPLIHNAALETERIDGVYLPMPVTPTYDDFARFMEYLDGHPELDVHGLSVTIPHKEHALRWLLERGLEVSGEARGAGAVNTLSRRSSGWTGDNTDVAGALRALRGVAERVWGKLQGREAAVLGAGGAARAVIVGLVASGCRVTIFNRTPERAAKLAQELRCNWRIWEQRGDSGAEIIVNCTSVGMAPDAEAAPLSADAFRPGRVVFDTVYVPAETRLLRDARERGCHVVGGEEMFIGQAAAQFEIWQGRPAPVAAMRAALATRATPASSSQ